MATAVSVMVSSARTTVPKLPLPMFLRTRSSGDVRVKDRVSAIQRTLAQDQVVLLSCISSIKSFQLEVSAAFKEFALTIQLIAHRMAVGHTVLPASPCEAPSVAAVVETCYTSVPRLCLRFRVIPMHK